MGAFAALAFRSEIGASHVIAHSPQFSVRADFDDRWAHCFEGPYLHNIDQRSDKDIPCLVVFDPRSKDRLHAAQIRAQIPTVIELKVPYSGHHPSAILNELQLLDACQREFLLGGELGGLHKEFKRLRRQSPSFLLHLAGTLGSRRRSLAAHARYIAAGMATSGPDDPVSVLRMLLDQRFRDPSRYLSESPNTKTVDLPESSELEALATIARQSETINYTNDQAPRVSFELVTQDINIDSLGEYCIRVPLRPEMQRFILVQFTGDCLGNKTLYSVLDLEKKFAFNVESRNFCAWLTKGTTYYPMVFFEVALAGKLRIEVKELHRYALMKSFRCVTEEGGVRDGTLTAHPQLESSQRQAIL